MAGETSILSAGAVPCGFQKERLGTLDHDGNPLWVGRRFLVRKLAGFGACGWNHALDTFEVSLPRPLFGHIPPHLERRRAAAKKTGRTAAFRSGKLFPQPCRSAGGNWQFTP